MKKLAQTEICPATFHNVSYRLEKDKPNCKVSKKHYFSQRHTAAVNVLTAPIWSHYCFLLADKPCSLKTEIIKNCAVWNPVSKNETSNSCLESRLNTEKQPQLPTAVSEKGFCTQHSTFISVVPKVTEPWALCRPNRRWHFTHSPALPWAYQNLVFI